MTATQITLPAADTTADETITIVAYGVPKPKGSLKHIGNGRLVEQVEGSGGWRKSVADAARKAMRGGVPGYYQLKREPLDGPVCVEITATFFKPKSAPKTRESWPCTRATGDSDKIARNVLDAIVDGRVLVDDSRVVDLVCRKVYPGQHADALDRPGAVIRIKRIGGGA